MGYYTHFKLTVTPEADETLNEELTGTPHSGDYIGAFDYYNKTYYGSEWKWYDHETDMTFLSERYPEYVFQLVGDGEETGDYWVMYFKGGKSYTMSLVIPVPPFDESLLGQD